jgi:hypothetical protein
MDQFKAKYFALRVAPRSEVWPGASFAKTVTLYTVENVYGAS